MQLALVQVDATPNLTPIPIPIPSPNPDPSPNPNPNPIPNQVDAEMGPFEVRPGTHLDLAPAAPPRAPDGERGGKRGAGPLPIRVLVGPGDVTVYSSNVQHRGGAHTGTHARPTFHIAVIGDGAAPTGIPYTVLAEDIRAMYPAGDPQG